jgi:hypothetical protein
VKWGGSRSSLFPMVNGTRQGSILSPALFALYVDELLVELRSLGIGCKVAGVFMGAVGFCDDLLLLAPTRDGMQVMLDTCQRFALKYNLKFSTDPNPVKSKTKCIFVCGKSKTAEKPAPLFLDGKELPWVDSAVHLGNVLHESGSMDKDVKVKRATFIRESTDLRDTFGFANPAEVLRAVKLYAGSHYGSNLWDLGSDIAAQYFTSWRTCVKLAWQVPRQTHTYFVDHLLCSGLSSVRCDILARYSKFVKGLRVSPSMEVTIMCGVVARDVQSTTGHNLNILGWETGLDPLTCSQDKLRAALSMRLPAVPDGDTWRMNYLGKLLEARGQAHYKGDDVTELTDLIDSLCTT